MDITSLIQREPVPSLPEPGERSRLRKVFGITQNHLARSLGVSRNTVIAWEYGRKEPTGENRENYRAILTAWAETEKERTDSHDE
jgi:DNA-binding transcriptional regulator YiaG